MKKKFLVIVQARSSSRRFKNKILSDFNGSPLIWSVILSLKKSRLVKKIVVATSTDKSDNKLITFLKKKNCSYFRGSLNNVAKRLTDAASLNKSKYFVRISGDSPVINHRIIDKILNWFNNSSNKNWDILTNVFPRTYESGNSVEVIKNQTLKKNIKFMNSYEKEHVTKFFYKNNKNFLIKNFINLKKKNKIKMSIDTKKDLINLLRYIKKS